jgi:hypothetical protein
LPLAVRLSTEAVLPAIQLGRRRQLAHWYPLRTLMLFSIGCLLLLRSVTTIIFVFAR